MTMLISKLVSGRTSYVRFGSKAESGGIYPIVFLTAMRAREASAGETSETPSITLAKDQCNKYSGAKFLRI
jgi:hypothetical protein